MSARVSGKSIMATCRVKGAMPPRWSKCRCETITVSGRWVSEAITGLMSRVPEPESNKSARLSPRIR